MLMPVYMMGKNRQRLTLLAALDGLLVTQEDKNFALGCHSTPSLLPHISAIELAPPPPHFKISRAVPGE